MAGDIHDGFGIHPRYDAIGCEGFPGGMDDNMKKLDQISALAAEYPGWMVERQMTGRFPDSI